MRHKIKSDRFGRSTSLRKAAVKSIIRAALINQSIVTTYTKAKAAAPHLERLLGLTKKNNLSSKRQAYKILCDHKLVSRLFGEIAELIKNRQTGFIRLIKAGVRRGDNAQMAVLELTDKAVKEKKPKKGKAAAVKGQPPDHEVQMPHKKEEKPKDKKEDEPSGRKKEGMPQEEKKEEKPAKGKKKADEPKGFFKGLRGFFKKGRDDS